MKEDEIDIFCEDGSLNGIYDKFYGTMKMADGVVYDHKEVEVIIQQRVLTGKDLTMNQHLIKKVFSGEIQSYRGNHNRKVGNGNTGRNSKSVNPVRVHSLPDERGSKSWDQVASTVHSGPPSPAQGSLGLD